MWLSHTVSDVMTVIASTIESAPSRCFSTMERLAAPRPCRATGVSICPSGFRLSRDRRGYHSPMHESAIECRGLTKRFKGRWAVDGLDLDIPRGTTFGLLGPNGAGKTTTIQMVLGLIRPTAGESKVLGGSIRSKAIRTRVGFVPEKFQLPTYLSCREFLTTHAELAGIPASQRGGRVRSVLELTSLVDRADDRLRGYSKGMQQRAMIAQALLAEPELLILDEPTSALDPLGRRDVRRLIEVVANEGTTVVLNSHILSEVEAVCSSAAIMQSGRVLRTGTMAELKGNRLRVHVVADGLDDRTVQRLRDALGDDATVQDQLDGRLAATGLVTCEQDMPLLASIVLEGGGRLFELRHESESLEDAFIRMVGPGTEQADR